MSFLMEPGVYFHCIICKHKFNVKYLTSILEVDGYLETVCEHCKEVIEKLREDKPYGKTGITEKE